MPVLITNKIEKSPGYFSQLIPENNTLYITRSVQESQIPFLDKTNFFKISFFPAAVME